MLDSSFKCLRRFVPSLVHCWGRSEEVVGRAQANVRDLCLSGSRVELEEIILHELVDLHYGGLVTAAVAVVGRGEDRDDVALVRPVVSVHDQLMGAGDARQVI